MIAGEEEWTREKRRGSREKMSRERRSVSGKRTRMDVRDSERQKGKGRAVCEARGGIHGPSK